MLNTSKTINPATTIVFIDAGVENAELLIEGVIPTTEVLVLDGTADGIEQISQVLQQRQNIDAVHIISHGSPGCLYLGNSQLSLDTLIHYAPQLQKWDVANLLLYGCNVAAGDAGEEFIAKLHALAGAEIAASKTLTGSAAKGGNWELEVTTAKVVVTLALESATLENYRGIFVNIGYYDIRLGQGNTNQTAPILVAGETPVNLTDLTATDLTGIDVIFIQNPTFGYSNGGNEFLNRLPSLHQAVFNGANLIIHDRAVGNAESILPGVSGLGNFIFSSLSDNINVADSTTKVTNGPGGIVNDTILDGGSSSNHGYANVANLPAGSRVILNNGNTSQAVTFSYPYGAGNVIYSTIPLDYYLNGPSPLGFKNVYAPNVIEYAANGLNKVNQAPTDLSLSNTSINENVAANSSVGTFTSTDPDTGNTFTYSLVPGTGDTNNSAFSVASNQLRINASPDFETKSTYNIRVRTTDQGGLTYEKALVVNINDIDEFIYGTPNNDILNGTASGDQINGLAGSDIIYGKAGNDIINGGDGDDVVYGGNDKDLLRGGNGSDRLYGDAGNDELLGEEGDDILYGGDGDDLLNGGAGSDRLYGNAGIDTFVLASGMGLDSIYNFQDGTDRIRLDGGLTFGALQIAPSGTSTLIKIASTGETLASLVNTNSALIGAADFSAIGPVLLP